MAIGKTSHSGGCPTVLESRVHMIAFSYLTPRWCYANPHNDVDDHLYYEFKS